MKYESCTQDEQAQVDALLKYLRDRLGNHIPKDDIIDTAREWAIDLDAVTLRLDYLTSKPSVAERNKGIITFEF